MNKVDTKIIFIRIVTILLILLSVLILPWYITIMFSILAAFYFERFYEFILIAFFLNSLYVGSGFSWDGYLFIILATFIFIFIEWIKTKLVFY